MQSQVAVTALRGNGSSFRAFSSVGLEAQGRLPDNI
jgi:hypothetical protein